MLPRLPLFCLLLCCSLWSQLRAQIPQQPGAKPAFPAARAAQFPGGVQRPAPGVLNPAGGLNNRPGAMGAAGERQAIKVDDAISEDGVELQFPNTQCRKFSCSMRTSRV